MYEYHLFTNAGKFKFFADNDIEAARLGLFYAWRDGEQFIKIDCSCQREQRSSLLEPMPSAAELGRSQSAFGGKPYTIRLCIVDKTNSISTL